MFVRNFGRMLLPETKRWLQPRRLDLITLCSVHQAIVRVTSKWLAIEDASLRLFSVSFLDLLRVFLNFLVDDFYRGEKVSQEQDEKC